jgi:hypothetical protein
MGSNNSTPQKKYFNEEIKENSQIFDCNTVLGVEINKLEEFMDSIFSEEVPKDFQDAMKKKIRVIRYSDKADNFKGKDNQTGLESNSFECNDETHYFFFIAEKKENKMDISYKFFVGKGAIIKAFTMIGKKKIVDTSKNYKEKLKEVVNNPLCTGKIYLIKEELRKNLLIERKNNLLEK